jgi:CDP-glycerol glycerophosphotransferase
LKEYLKNLVKQTILGHTVKLDSTDDSIIFKLEHVSFLGKKFLLIKHRKTGKRISKPVTSSKIEVFNTEIEKMGEFGRFDIYLKIMLGGQEFLSRTKFESDNKNHYLVNKQAKTIFRPYKTLNSNLSFNLKEALFVHKVTSLESDTNQVCIKGVINLFEDITFDSVEIAAKNKDIQENKLYKLEYAKKEDDIHFKGRIKFGVEEKYMNTTWDLFIQLSMNGIVMYRESLRSNDLKQFKSFEDYYLAVIEGTIRTDHDKSTSLDVVSYYYASQNNYIKFRIVSKDKWLETFKRSKYEAIYEQSCLKEKIDNNLIFFESFKGQSYSHNPKYIYEKMLELGYASKYTFVWSYEGDLKIPGNPVIVNRDEDTYYKYLATSKFWINNISFPVKEKREDIIFLQTTHGTPLKRMGIDIENASSKIVTGNITREAEKWDYLIAPNKYSHDIFLRAFMYEKTILNTGYPANDIFYADVLESKKSQIKSDLGLDENKQIILYAPTFRDLEVDNEGNHYFNLEIDLDLLNTNFNDDYIILLRLHYIISNIVTINGDLKDFVLDVSFYDDIHELCLISDILITDYSSVFFDFAHTKKPILFFTPDFMDYESTRGLYLDIRKDLPGPLLFDMQDLINGIKNIDEIERNFKDSYHEFYKIYCNWGHGNASKKVVNTLIKGE